MKRRHFIKTGSTVALGLPLLPNTLIFKKINLINMKREFEVLVIGGSYAGLSAAMALGRSLRQVLVIDSGLPCNRFTPHSHNFITHDGATPAEITRQARQQVERYDTVHFHEGLAMEGRKTGAGFEIETQAGEVFFGKKLVFATGLRDDLPDLPGLSDCWGKTALHCPYCHGYEVRKQPTAVLGNGGYGYDFGKLISQWTDDLTLLTNGESTLSEEQAAKLQKHGIRIVETKISHLEHAKGKLRSVVFKDKTSLPLHAMYLRPNAVQHCKIPHQLGCELTEMGTLKVDIMQKTTVPGVFACGDNMTMGRAVAAAVATGMLAGAVTNAMLVEEVFG